MILNKTNNELEYFQFSNLCRNDGLHHFVSTRKGGRSLFPFNDLNLGLKVADEETTVLYNRSLLADSTGISIRNFVIPSQCHSNNVQIVSEEHRGMGVFDKTDALIDTDALVSNTKGVCIMIFAADCVPVLFFDPVQNVIAAAHAGWKGTVNKIVQQVVFSMKDNFGSMASDILAGIGPSIGSCCYNVGSDVISQVKVQYTESQTEIILQSHANGVFLDLWQANKINLTDVGLPPENIEIAELCTSCRSDLFFSHRKSGGNTGRFGAGIMLK